MSYGTSFNTEIYLNRIIINSSYELDSKIQDSEETLVRIKQLIMMYVSANPKDIVPEDWKDDGLDFVHQKVEALLLEYEQELKMLIDLNYYKETNPFNHGTEKV